MNRYLQLKPLIFTLLAIVINTFAFSQSHHTVSFSGSTTDFNAAEKYSSVDNVDYYVTYDATYVYFGAFRNGGNTWGAFDHFTIYIDNFGVGAGSATGVNWDGNTPTLPFASDYRIALRNNSSGESFFSTYSGSWTTGAANAQAWNQYTTASADGALEVRVPWTDIGNPNAIRFITYASYNTGYYGYAPAGSSGVGPSAGSQWFGTIGTKSADCIPTNTTNLTLTGTGSLTNTVPAAAGTYARVTINAGTVTNANAWTLAPGGILEVTGGTFAIGAQTITFGNAATSNGKGTTISTSGAGVITSIATSVLAFGGEGNIVGNNLSTNATVRILNKFTPLALGGLTFNAGANLDIRSGGYINTNAPTYASGSNLNYNSGGAYTAGAEWSGNATSGAGVPSNVNIGNLIASSQLDFGATTQFRQLNGNFILSATATFALSTAIGGDLQIGGSITNTAGSVFTHNNRAVTFNGTIAQNLNSTPLTLAYLIIANTSATVTTVANTTILNNLIIDPNARLNIGATTLTITGATSAINGFLRSAGTIAGASVSTLTFNSGGAYEHNYTTTLGVIPTATWNAGSNCNIIGYTTALVATGANGYGQAFSNFTWNCTLQAATIFNLASQLTTINGNLSILSTGATGSLILSNTSSTTITVGGNLIQSGGICVLSTAATNLNVSGDFNQSGGTLTISNTAAVISFLNITGNVNKTGGTVIVSSNTGAAQLVVSGNFTQSLGTTTVSASTGVPQLNITGVYTQSGGTTNVSTAASGAALMNITSDFVISGGTFNVASAAAPSILNVTGNVTNIGGTLNIGATGISVLNANSNYIQSAGTTNISTGAGAALLNVLGNFTFSGGVLTKTVSGVMVGTITFNGSSNQNINITDPTNITGAVSFRLNNASGITILNGSTLPVNTLASFRRSLGSVTLIGTGVITYNASNSRLTYDGTTDITTSNAEWPAINGPVNVTIGHSLQSNITLHAPRVLPATGVLTINALNRLILGTNDLTITNTAALGITITPLPTSMIVAEGAGRLIRSVTTGLTYTWPIGDMTGTIEYSPVLVNFTASSTARDIGFNVVNGTHPQMNNPDPQSHYRNRYFGVYNSAAGTYTYNATFNYLAADNIGTVTNVKFNAYDGLNWIQAPQTTSAATNSFTTIPVNETTFPLVTGYDVVCRSKPQIYEWIPVTGTQSFATAANWSPARNVLSFDDILSFPNGGSSIANTVTTQTIGKILLSNNTDITLLPSAAATLVLSGGLSTDLDIPLGCTLTLGGAPSTFALTITHLLGAGNTAAIAGNLNISTNAGVSGYTTTNSTTNVTGTINNNGSFITTTSTTNINGIFNNLASGAVTSAAANLFFNAGATYNHNRNFGAVPTAAWDITSNCNINGVTANAPTGLNQAFGNFTWNSTAQSGSVIMGANVFNAVNGNLSFLSTNNQVLNISSTASTLIVGGNLFIDIGTGTLRLPSAAAVNVSMNVNGNTTLNSGAISHINTGIATLNFSGNVSLVAGSIIRTTGTSNINFIKTSGTQTLSQTATTFSGIHNIGVGNGTTANTLQLLSNFDFTATASPFTVNQNATLDCGTFVLSGSTAAFTLSNTAPGATLITANNNGIELTGASGSIQTTGARSYGANANYWFNGTSLQNTGLALTAANNLTIDNSSNVNLTTSITVTGTTSFLNGKLILNSSNFSATNVSGNPFAGQTTGKYIATNGSGQVFRSIATTGLPINYVFPVGDAANYAPVALSFTANSLARNIGVITTAGAVPYNLPSSDYINRSWTFTNSAAGTYTYTPTYTYDASDVVGTETSMKISRYVGPLWTEFNATPNTIVTPPQMTLSGSLNETTGPLSSYWTGRLYAAPVSYTWNGSTSNDWNIATNWTPNGIPGIIDNVLINTSAINPCVANGVFFGTNNFTVSGTGNFQLAANAALTVNGNYAISASVTFNCSSTLNITSTTAQTIPAANYGNLNISGGNRTLANIGTIGICGQFTTGAGVITITGSTIDYNSTQAQTITATTYNNLTISQNRGSNLITLEPGTITLNGLFTPSLTNYTIFVDGNTFNFNGVAGQTIPAFFYFNLTSAAASRVWANVGIIDIKGTFTPPATGNTITGSTVRFSSTLPGINLSIYTTNVANRNFNNVIFDGVGGTWDAGAANLRPNGTLTLNNGTVNVANAAASILAVAGTTTVNGGVLNLATNIGTGTGTFTGALTVNGGILNITSGTGAATVTFSSTTTITGGTLNLSNGSAAATIASMGAINVNGGNFVVANTTTSVAAFTTGAVNVNGGTFTGSNTTAAVVAFTIGGNLSINGGTLRLTNALSGSPSTTITLNGNLAVNSGLFTKASGTGLFNFNFTTSFPIQTRTFSQGVTAIISGNTTFQCTGTTGVNSLSITSDLNLGSGSLRIYNTGSGSGYTINMNQNIISSTGTFQLANGARFRTDHPDGIAAAPVATGCIQTSVRNLGGSCLWWFEGSGPQRTGTGFPGSVDQLTISNGTAGFTLDRSVRIQSALSTPANSYIILGNNNLHIGYYLPPGQNASYPAGTDFNGGGYSGSATRRIITNGTGMLVRHFSSASGSYTFAIASSTASSDYTPVTINVSSLSAGQRNIGFRVTSGMHPNNTSTNYLNRYWTAGMMDSTTTYTYNADYSYLNADVVGVESLIRIMRWDGASWNPDGTSSINTTGNVLNSTTGLNQITCPLYNNDFTGGDSNTPLYYQSVNSGNWSNVNTWQASTDPAFTSPPPFTPGSAPTATNSLGINIRNTHSVALDINTDADEMTINAGGTLSVNMGLTLTIADDTGTDLIVDGNINNAGVIVTAGTLEFNSGATYNHTQNGGNIPTSTWNNGSSCEITGIVNTVPTGLNQSFYDFEWNCTGQNTPIQLAGLLTNISNNFTLSSSGSPANDLRVFDNNNTGTLNIGSNLNITGGQLALINSATSGSGNATININGNLIVNGVLDMTGSLANTAASSSINLKGDLDVNGTGKIIRSQNVTSTITFNSGFSTQSFTSVANGVNTNPILYRVGDGTTFNTVIMSGNIDIGSGSTFRVMGFGTLNCQPSAVLTGTDFDMQNNSRLIIGSLNGIADAPSASGNIQTTNRNFNSTAEYTYQGLNNQITGDGLPINITGSLIINNIGTSPNNVVSLSTSGTTTSVLELNLGKLSIGAGQQLNMNTGGNVFSTSGDFSIGTAGGTINFNGSGSFSGNMNPYNVYIEGAVDFGSNTVTIQNGGTLRINTGGSVFNNAVYYASNSNLQYNVNGNFNRGLEWSAASGRGYPYHVQLSNNTVLNAAGAGAVNAGVPFNTAGNLTIDAGSTLSMNFGGNNMTVPLNVAGNVSFAGNLTASNTVGGNIALQGNWVNDGAAAINFTPNSRIVTFNGSTLQSITGTNTSINPFAQLTVNNPAGITLTALDVEVQNGLNLQNGIFDLNNKKLTLGTIGNNGTLTGGSATSYLISGTTTAKFVRYTTTNATTYDFPLGDAVNYTPISVQFYSSPMAANTQLSVNVIPAAHPGLGTSTDYLTRYWTVEPNNLPNALTDYGVTYKYADADIFGNETSLKPFKHSPVGWIAAIGSGATFEMGTGSVTPGNNTITWTGLNNFSDFTGNGSGSPLPISLLNFNAQLVLENVEVTWTTLTETNNDYFTIEKSKNAIDFNKIAEVPGAGNSNQLLNYKLIDDQPYEGISYYRLKQTDFDGKFTYSDIRTVNRHVVATQSNFNVYPNPSNLHGVYLVLPGNFDDENTTVQILDIYGKVLSSKVYTVTNSRTPIYIDLAQTANGIYTLQMIQNNGQVSARKITIIE